MITGWETCDYERLSILENQSYRRVTLEQTLGNLNRRDKMAFSESWSVLEPDLETVFDHEEDPLQALADARIPGIALRGAYNPDHCSGLMQRFIERGMTRDPEQSNPEGNLPSRIDIGSSLVNRARGGLAVSDDETENKDAFP